MVVPLEGRWLRFEYAEAERVVVAVHRRSRAGRGRAAVADQRQVAAGLGQRETRLALGVGGQRFRCGLAGAVAECAVDLHLLVRQRLAVVLHDEVEVLTAIEIARMGDRYQFQAGAIRLERSGGRAAGGEVHLRPRQALVVAGEGGTGGQRHGRVAAGAGLAVEVPGTEHRAEAVAGAETVGAGLAGQRGFDDGAGFQALHGVRGAGGAVGEGDHELAVVEDDFGHEEGFGERSVQGHYAVRADLKTGRCKVGRVGSGRQRQRGQQEGDNRSERHGGCSQRRREGRRATSYAYCE